MSCGWRLRLWQKSAFKQIENFLSQLRQCNRLQHSLTQVVWMSLKIVEYSFLWQHFGLRDISRFLFHSFSSFRRWIIRKYIIVAGTQSHYLICYEPFTITKRPTWDPTTISFWNGPIPAFFCFKFFSFLNNVQKKKLRIVEVGRRQVGTLTTTRP